MIDDALCSERTGTLERLGSLDATELNSNLRTSYPRRGVGSQFSDFYKTPEKKSENCWLSISNTVPFSKFFEFLEPIALDTLIRGAWGACLPARALRT